MNYTIASIEDVRGTITVEFEKSGNKYLVGIYETETKEFTHKKYDEMETAYSVFEKLSKAIITGCYSYEDRKGMLV